MSSLSHEEFEAWRRGSTEKPTVKPFWGRVTIIPDVAEADEPSLLNLLADARMNRGVVDSIDALVYEGGYGSQAAEQIPPGTVVYYRGGLKIGDVVVVQVSEIFAYEERSAGS